LRSIRNKSQEVVLQQFENKRVLRRVVRNKSICRLELGGDEGMAQGQMKGHLAAEIEVTGLRHKTAAGSNNRRHMISSD
jgi:hypothetical protein